MSLWLTRKRYNIKIDLAKSVRVSACFCDALHNKDIHMHRHLTFVFSLAQQLRGRLRPRGIQIALGLKS